MRDRGKDRRASLRELVRAAGRARSEGRKAWRWRPAAPPLLLAAASCSSPVVKAGAWDRGLVERLSQDGRIEQGTPGAGERIVHPGNAWLVVDPERLSFVRLRDESERGRYAVVLACRPENDLLLLLPLGEDETPLDALDDDVRSAELRERVRAARADPEHPPGDAVALSASEAVEDKRLGPPLPEPRRILAVAANFASHLVHDLDLSPEVIDAFRSTPPRVFQKHPPLPAPGSDPRPDLPFRGVIGPYDSIVYPDVVSLPHDEQDATHVVPTYLDYEVEVAFVLGRRLTRDQAERMTDEELWRCIAGYVLVSDVKARNPQVFERILLRDEVPTESEKRYLTGNAEVDTLIGKWDEETCAWWGYAASQGDYAALGPYFVEAGGEPRLVPRDVVCARSYGSTGQREVERPRKRQPGTLYLRQCARVSEGEADEHLEGVLWGPVEVLRAVLSPRGALSLGPEPALERGDVIALGTPGGIALTVNRGRFFRVMQTVLFWWDALDWHDAFFGRDASFYLYEGDRVFLWGSGLGFQLLDVHRFELPSLPKTVDEDAVPEAVGSAAPSS